MALGIIHCGSFLLFAAFALLLVATISAPVIERISFLNIEGQGLRSTFGTFGYCVNANVSFMFDFVAWALPVSPLPLINTFLRALSTETSGQSPDLIRPPFLLPGPTPHALLHTH